MANFFFQVSPNSTQGANLLISLPLSSKQQQLPENPKITFIRRQTIHVCMRVCSYIHTYYIRVYMYVVNLLMGIFWAG